MKTLIVDVREPSEFARGHVEGAVNIPPSQLMAGAPQLNNVPKDTQIILYCLSGSRSNSSMRFLQAMGFTNLVNGINKDQVNKLLGR
ncbi:rhodanese-like domain-containing protein [Candidatus Saccharibacteria bacterium]|jgi:phage shock protein E|nr:rhodanese-like domain-containing protein [Candidatus Saccharibacteria bacterium]